MSGDPSVYLHHASRQTEKPLLKKERLFSKTGGEDVYVRWWLEQQKKRRSSTVQIHQLTAWVRNTVFSPAPDETHSSAFLIESLPDPTGLSFLDIGAGCGILGLYAIQHEAAHITISDCDLEAIQNIKENLASKQNCRNITLNQGDLFDGLSGAFDIVSANLPIVDIAWPNIKEGTNNLHARFMQKIPDFLASKGSCYLSFASFGDIDGFEELLLNQELNYSVALSQRFGVNWYTIKLSKD